MLVGSLAIFLFGMKSLSEALQKMAGGRMRSVISSFTSNKFGAVLTGATVSAAIQSSGATIVMVISFVNAGLLSLGNAIGVIMGSNIGTTFTAWIITLVGLNTSIAGLAIPIFGIGFLMMFFRNKSLKALGDFLIGFSMLFLGLNFMKDNVAGLNLSENQAFLDFIASFANGGNITALTVLLFVLIGTILTVALQSSTAMMAITLVLCSQGAIPFEIAIALVLGENLGTTITANVAAIIGNTSSKMAARSHFLFNAIGLCWVLILFRPFLNLIAFLTEQITTISPYDSNLIMAASAIPISISLFHTCFNVLNTCVLIWFIPQLEKLAKHLVRNADSDDEVFKLKYIDPGFMQISELTIEPAKKEIQVFSKRVCRMYEFLPVLMNEKDAKKYEELFERTKKYEEITDRMEMEISRFLSKIAEHELSKKSSQEIHSMLRIIDNLESIGDVCYQIAKTVDNKKEQDSHFSPEMKQNLGKMFDLVRRSLEIMDTNLNTEYSHVALDDASNIETEINNYRDVLKNQHFEDIKNNVYSYETGVYYSSIFSLLEKLGDNVLNITEAVVNVKLRELNAAAQTSETAK